jgi:hypothetical protein
MNQTRWLAGAGLTAVAITVVVVGASLLPGNGAAGDEVERDRERAVAGVAEFREAMAVCHAGIAAEQDRFAAHGPGGTGWPRPSAPELRDPAPSAHAG